LVLGVLFIVLTSLFSVYTPKVVREAFDLIGTGIAQRDLPVAERHLDLPQQVRDWTAWTGIDLQAKMDGPLDDAALEHKVKWFAGFYAGLFLLFTLLQGLFLFFTRQTIIVVSRLMEFDLKNAVYAHYQQLDRAFYKRNSTGDLMNRISEDVTKVRQFIGPAVMYIINLVVLTLMIVWVMWGVNEELTIWSLAPLPLLSIAIYLVSDTINRRSMATQQQQSRLSSLAQETFSGMRVIKSYSKEALVNETLPQSGKGLPQNKFGAGEGGLALYAGHHAAGGAEHCTGSVYRWHVVGAGRRGYQRGQHRGIHVVRRVSSPGPSLVWA
jgi:ATP-binding cassette subfamily B protein